MICKPQADSACLHSLRTGSALQKFNRAGLGAWVAMLSFLRSGGVAVVQEILLRASLEEEEAAMFV